MTGVLASRPDWVTKEAERDGWSSEMREEDFPAWNRKWTEKLVWKT